LKNLLYIGNKLSKHGVTPTTLETLGPLLELEGFDVKYSSSQKNQLVRLISMLYSVFLYRKVDCVLIDAYSTTNFWFAFATSQLCRLFCIKYIPILHGGNLPSRLKRNTKICKMIFKHSFQNVSPSLFLINEFKAKGYDNVIHIPNAIELDKYAFLERKQASPNLLWVRSFAKIYNPIMAVEVFASLKIKYPNATLCMVGPEKDGSLVASKKRAKELNVEVFFTGKLPKQNWIDLSTGYTIFINTTRFDNMPVSVIEVMALGLAVVSTNVGGIPFLLENDTDSLLIPEGNVEEMVKAIIRLLEEPDLFRKITIAARHKSEQLEWLEIKMKWLAVLK
jgi:glycosyltransferase involved in cell wall biosynthesis